MPAPNPVCLANHRIKLMLAQLRLDLESARLRALDGHHAGHGVRFVEPFQEVRSRDVAVNERVLNETDLDCHVGLWGGHHRREQARDGVGDGGFRVGDHVESQCFKIW